MDILQEIIAIDKAASERIETLRAEQQKRITDSGKAAVSRNEQLVLDERKKLDELREADEKALAEKKEACEQTKKAETERLDSVFSQNRDKWMSEITDRITGV